MAPLLVGSAHGRMVSFPWQVVRRRMMAGAAYPSVLAAVRTIAAEEGWRALYRGLGVSCIKQAPQTGAEFPLLLFVLLLHPAVRGRRCLYRGLGASCIKQAPRTGAGSHVCIAVCLPWLKQTTQTGASRYVLVSVTCCCRSRLQLVTCRPEMSTPCWRCLLPSGAKGVRRSSLQSARSPYSSQWSLCSLRMVPLAGITLWAYDSAKNLLRV